ncbi:MAG: hypothetical protein OXE52_03760 [Chloroflexi bacterium]|nr:hypothetical protein [Chloroflexota bacterium]
MIRPPGQTGDGYSSARMTRARQYKGLQRYGGNAPAEAFELRRHPTESHSRYFERYQDAL